MICPKGHVVPDKMLVCPICTQANWDKGEAEYQREFLRRALAGNAPLRVIKSRTRHVMLYGPSLRTFCGTTLEARPTLAHEPYTDETLAKVCPGCRQGLASAVEELR